MLRRSIQWIPARFSCEKCGNDIAPVYYKSIHDIVYEYSELKMLGYARPSKGRWRSRAFLAGSSVSSSSVLKPGETEWVWLLSLCLSSE